MLLVFGSIYVLGVYMFNEGWSGLFLVPIVLTVIGFILFLFFIARSIPGRILRETISLEQEYYQRNFDDSLLQERVSALVDSVNTGNEIESGKAIEKLEHILGRGYRFGISARAALASLNPALYAKYLESPRARLTRFSITCFLILFGIIVIPGVLLPAWPLELAFWQLPYARLEFILVQFFAQAIILSFGFEGSIDTKLV